MKQMVWTLKKCQCDKKPKKKKKKLRGKYEKTIKRLDKLNATCHSPIASWIWGGKSYKVLSPEL